MIGSSPKASSLSLTFQTIVQTYTVQFSMRNRKKPNKSRLAEGSGKGILPLVSAWHKARLKWERKNM